ncbi:hypothetical protein DPMN_099948 [Dreissena polymorpha]|uniref:Uncharacterized protein n=1 Tax=Dreissena polymorpha TaxID=45954 RepID=A0A9D4R6W9_DREPO|nr:hypothetical protein DPMN_099948 [Dreissena polymorpha]
MWSIANQNAFSPNEAFKGFVTQTGSEPHGRGGNLNFNPDKVNQMKDPDNSLAGSVSQTPQGTSGGYRFNAYEDAERPSFDATALNQALMTFNKPNIQPEAFFPNYRSNLYPQRLRRRRPPIKGSRTLQTRTQPRKKPPVRKQPKRHRFSVTPAECLSRKSVLGRWGVKQLFRRSAERDRADCWKPSLFADYAYGNQAFDPNLLNSGQSNFNPNAQSWIRTRRETTKETDDNGNGLTTFPHDGSFPNNRFTVGVS